MTRCKRCKIDGCNPGCVEWKRGVSSVEGVPFHMVPVFTAIAWERFRQEHLKREGKYYWSLSDILRHPQPDERNRMTAEERAVMYDVSPSEKLAVLQEGVGEVAREVCEGFTKGTDFLALRAELIRVAACCVAWCEAIDESSTQREEVVP